MGEPHEKKKICIGLLAHVDAGKTTLSERILYQAQTIRRLGRVDKQTAFLDSDPLERQRGITIFSAQAPFVHNNVAFTLLDTPGHVDFSSEMERVLSVLDCAVLVVSAVEGVQAHTETIWRLLCAHRVPVFFFINKVDLDTADPAAVLQEISARLTPDVCNLSDGFTTQAIEQIAEADDDLLSAYFETGYDPARWQSAARQLVQNRRLFPCYLGSAQDGAGVTALLDGLSQFSSSRYFEKDGPLQARVFRISHDDRGVRWAHLRLFSGCLTAKQSIGDEKIHELRRFTGEKSVSVPLAAAGEVCAVSGLSSLRPGDGIGLPAAAPPQMQPALSAEILYPSSVSPQRVLSAFRQLEEEDPLLHIAFEADTNQLRLQVMGKIQLEVLSALIPQRFGFSVTFGPCRVLYQETIAAPVCGFGHFEPLRHYAEVHFRLAPGPRGSGLVFQSALSTDVLPAQFQNLIRTHVFETTHPGLLTGSPVTDLSITLTNGRAHEKHTEGGDFRQAVCRAIRQGLEQAQNVLLEPYYAFTLTVPERTVGRALTDLQRKNASFGAPQLSQGRSTLAGRAPAACMMEYAAEVASYTKGEGVLQLRFDGYDVCHNTEQVIQAIGYNKVEDRAHPSSSVFCSHGAGYPVPWQEVRQHLHCPVVE